MKYILPITLGVALGLGFLFLIVAKISLDQEKLPCSSNVDIRCVNYRE